MSDIIESTYAHYLVFGGSILGLVWGGVNVLQVSNRFKGLLVFLPLKNGTRLPIFVWRVSDRKLFTLG